jgi:hypothetical protein
VACKSPPTFTLIAMSIGMIALGDTHTHAASTNATPPSPSAVDSELDPVLVRGRAPPGDQKHYRNFIDAITYFENHHELAPNSVLRFKVFPWHDGAVLQGLKLTLEGKTIERTIPIAFDGSFSLVRDERALEEGAELVSNRAPDSLAWRTDVRTPGLPANTRRLGDLRLECEVEFAANIAPYVWANYFAAPAEACHDYFFGKSWFADVPVFGVTFVDGSRRETLPARSVWGFHLPVRSVPYGDRGDGELWGITDWHDYMRDRLFTVPIEEKQWPDDTLVVLDPIGGSNDNAVTTRSSTPTVIRDPRVFTPQLAQQLFIPGTTTREEVKKTLGSATSIQFASGNEAWVYEYNPSTRSAPKWQDSEARSTDPAKTQVAQTFVVEIRVLFNDRGIVQKRLFILTNARQRACWAIPKNCMPSMRPSR